MTKHLARPIRQDKAKRAMAAVTAACVLAAAAPAVTRLAASGWGAFFTRPAGVGASETSQTDAAAPRATKEPQPAITATPQPTVVNEDPLPPVVDEEPQVGPPPFMEQAAMRPPRMPPPRRPHRRPPPRG